MVLNNFKVSGVGLETELKENAVPASAQNMSNWSTSGSGTVTLSYEDGVNTLEFSNNGTLTAVDLINRINTDLNYNLSTTDTSTLNRFNNLIDNWESFNYGLVVGIDTNNDIYICVLRSNTFYVSGSSGNYTLNFDECGVTYTSNDHWYVALKYYIGGIDRYINYGKYSDFPKGVTKNYYLDTTVEDEKVYLVKFKACSPSGFDTSSSPNTIITCGSNVINSSISNTASNDFTDYEFIIISDGTALDIKFDLEKIQKSSGNITLKFRDFGVYEINDELDHWSDGIEDIENDSGDAFTFLG